MHDKRLGIKVVIKSLPSNTQCAEFIRPDACDSSSTSQEVTRERFIQVTYGHRFSITVAFKEDFDFQNAWKVNISRQIDEQAEVSDTKDKQRVKLQELMWDMDAGFMFKPRAVNFNGIFKDKLVDGTGVISVAVRLGNDDGVGFVPLQPAVRFIFRYGSKERLQNLGLVYPDSSTPVQKTSRVDPRFLHRLELNQYRAGRQAEESRRGIVLRPAPSSLPRTSFAAVQPTTRLISSETSSPRPLEQEMSIRNPPAKKRKLSGLLELE